MDKDRNLNSGISQDWAQFHMQSTQGSKSWSFVPFSVQISRFQELRNNP